MYMYQQQILERLYELQDFGYQKFHANLMPGKDKIIGVRIPDLRALAKTISKDNAEEFLTTCPHDWYEQSMLFGMVLAQSGFGIEKVLYELDRFMPYIDNWAVCDCTANGLKIITKNKSVVWDWINNNINSEHPFTTRFCICLLMGYYIEDAYIDRVLDVFTNILSDHYYVKMGLAWALCECLIKQYNKTLSIIEQKRLSPWVQNKTIQKSFESFRITNEQKELLRSLKMK